MEDYSDSDTSSESEYDSDQRSASGSDCEDEPSENLEPELSEAINEEYNNTLWNPQAQLQSQFNTACLAQLHTEIKARAQLPDPTYQKLPRSWPARPFDVQILPDYIKHPIDYFELFWGSEVWNTLVENTNAYAQYIEARNKENKGKKSRWWKAMTLYEMRIFIALLIYMGIVCTSNISSYWNKSGLTIHKLMEYMTFFCFEQIKRYLHISPPPTSTRLSTTRWHTKLSPLSDLLRTKFKAYVVLGQDVSFDEMMVLFSRRSKHTLKMKNKLIKEGFKIWALCDHGYL